MIKNKFFQEALLKSGLEATPKEKLQMLADIHNWIVVACKKDYRKSKEIADYLNGKPILFLGKRKYAIILNEVNFRRSSRPKIRKILNKH